jgi:hypothetical protein
LEKNIFLEEKKKFWNVFFFLFSQSGIQLFERGVSMIKKLQQIENRFQKIIERDV